MVSTDEYKASALIKNLYLIKFYGLQRFVTEFPWEWMERVLIKFLMKLYKTGTSECKHSSGRLRTVHNKQHDWLKAYVLLKGGYLQY